MAKLVLRWFVAVVLLSCVALRTTGQNCFGESAFVDTDSDGLCDELDVCPYNSSLPDPNDDLSSNSEDFEVIEQLPAEWQIHNPALVAISQVSNGMFTLEPPSGGPAGSFWYNALEGNLVYIPITGDFDARAYVQVTNSAGDGPPPLSEYRLAGLSAHDPDRSQSNNFVHIAIGSGNTATLQVEWKSNENDVSIWQVSSWPSGLGELRLLRQGQVFTYLIRETFGEGAWTQIQQVDRSSTVPPTPLPDTLQVGFMCYSNQVVHDIALHVHYFSIRRPHLSLDLDSDVDGVADECDVCIGDDRVNSDGDLEPNCQDNCPDDPNKTDTGLCGCGTADTDTDEDGEPDCQDNCPDDPNKTDAGLCGCGTADTDTDEDGEPDCQDNCPDDPNKTDAGLCGCGTADTDTDSDGSCDNSCNEPAPLQDEDSDGIPDVLDQCPNSPSAALRTEPCGCDRCSGDGPCDWRLSPLTWDETQMEWSGGVWILC